MFENKDEGERFSTKRWQTLTEFDVTKCCVSLRHFAEYLLCEFVLPCLQDKQPFVLKTRQDEGFLS